MSQTASQAAAMNAYALGRFTGHMEQWRVSLERFAVDVLRAALQVTPLQRAVLRHLEDRRPRRARRLNRTTRKRLKLMARGTWCQP